MAKSCKKGYYYCNTSKKCKKIPRGYHVMSTGYLMRDNEHQDEKETEGKKKNGNGNGNHSNGNGNGNGSSSDGGGEGGGGGVSEAWSAKYKKSIDCDNPKGFSQKSHCRGKEKVSEGKNGDHEVAMAQSQLKKSAANIAKLRKALGKKEKDIPAWMQAKITDTAHDTDAAAGYADKIDESKSGDSSLRDWFGKSKSSDGKPGWVQLGGKYAGKPCAKQPGQKTKPKCGSSKMAANLDDKEEKKAFNRKQRQDPNPNRKGKAINVKTESYSNWREESKSIDEGAANVIRAGLAIGTGLAGLKLMDKAREVGEKVKSRNQKMQDAINKARGVKEEVIAERRDAGGRSSRDMIKMGGNGGLKTDQDLERERLQRLQNLKPGIKLDKAHYEPEGEMVDEGKKDACYHKVKSRYSVWPSAYASGALVKCRKVGAKNWGNKTKKESYEISNWREDVLLEGLEDKLKGMSTSQIEDLIKANKGAEEKIRSTLAGMRKSQETGVKLPNIPNPNPSYRETYTKGGSDRVTYQRRQTVTRADVQGRTEAAKRAASGQGRYRPGVGVTPDFKLDSKFKPPGSRGMGGKVRPRGRGGKIGAAIAAGSVLAPLVLKGVDAIKNRMQKEDYEFSNWRDDFHATEVESVDLISNEPLQQSQGLGSDMLDEAKSEQDKLKEISKQLVGASKMHAKQSKQVAKVAANLDEKCWKGYKKKGMKTMFGKRYPNCVKAHFSDWRSDMDLQEKEFKSHKMYDQKTGKGYDADTEEDHLRMKKMGYTHEKPEKKNCGCGEDPCKTYGKKEVKEDWQKSNRKDGVDGMSQKSVNAYKRANPGSKLKTAVTGKNPTGKDKNRRKSFCARSNGQRKMHNIDCSKTPDKKICKARKRWRC